MSGGIRDTFVRPRFGSIAAEVFGFVVLGAAILAAAFNVMPKWVHSPASLAALWLAMTVGFEFLFFHYIGGHSWGELIDAYRFWKGRLWVCVLLTLGLAPFIAARWQRPG